MYTSVKSLLTYIKAFIADSPPRPLDIPGPGQSPKN